MDKITQCQRVMRHLENVGPLTSAEAMYEYGIGHLASRISDLRLKEGAPIGKKMVSRKNRYGETVSFASYYLEVEQ